MFGLTMPTVAQDYQSVAFNPEVRYSEALINARINDFYANKKQMGLNVYDANGQLLKPNAGGSNLRFDYVPGLVAKAIIEAVDYYKNEEFARPWFYSVEDYANRSAASVPTGGKSLDDLNATKMYFVLSDLTAEGGAFASLANKQTHQNAIDAMGKAIQGLADCKENYSIKASTKADAAGGWFHKYIYPNQMWCDGQYMGPALLAQMIRYGYTINGAEQDWKTITQQFDITWHYLWDQEKELLWHAFSASPTDSYASTWADPKTGRSQEYWGRACGWYFLALVDVLELMPEGIEYAPTHSSLKGYSTDCKQRLKQYLNAMAKGLAARQDQATGCWYQLLAHDGTFYADSYNGKSYAKTYNYLESSASSIFTATYLKGMRLGFLPEEYAELADKAYKGLINQFVKLQEDGTYTLIDDCASAGLGGSSYRDGSAAYYLLGNDVTRITNYTEGKVYGAFILAAVEYERRQDAAKMTALNHVKGCGTTCSALRVQVQESGRAPLIACGRTSGKCPESHSSCEAPQTPLGYSLVGYVLP